MRTIQRSYDEEPYYTRSDEQREEMSIERAERMRQDREPPDDWDDWNEPPIANSKTK